MVWPRQSETSSPQGGIMKFAGIAAALALAVVPAVGFAQSAPTTDQTQNSAIEPGGIAQDGTATFTLATLPAEAYVAAGFVILGGAVIGILIGNSDDNTTATSTN